MELLQDSPPPRSNPLGTIEEEEKKKTKKEDTEFSFFFLSSSNDEKRHLLNPTTKVVSIQKTSR